MLVWIMSCNLQWAAMNFINSKHIQSISLTLENTLKTPHCINEATWRWCEPTCQFHKPYFDEDNVRACYLLIYELLSSEFWSSDRRTDRRKAMHKSPPCISTGGLKNRPIYIFCMVFSIWTMFHPPTANFSILDYVTYLNFVDCWEAEVQHLNSVDLQMTLALHLYSDDL